MTYVDELSRELTALGIRGRLRRRILAEVDDHLCEDPGAQERFGSPRGLANEFAADLGTRASRRAAFAAFGALAVSGMVYAALFVSDSPSDSAMTGPRVLAFVAAIVAPQVAFVAGALALLSAVRGRRLSTSGLVVLRRRTGTALAFGVLTMGSMAAVAGSTAAYVSTAAATLLLAAAAVPALAAARFKPQLAGPAGDVFDDLGLRRLRARLEARIATGRCAGEIGRAHV